MRLVVQKHVTIGLLTFDKNGNGLLALLANLPQLPLQRDCAISRTNLLYVITNELDKELIS